MFVACKPSCDKLRLCCHVCVASVEGTCVAVEQEDVAHDESCVEDDQQQELDVSHTVIYIHPKTEISYGAEQTEAN